MTMQDMGRPEADEQAGTTPAVSVVIPVFNEAPNIAPMVQRLAVALEGRDYEIIYVDDSTDHTPQVIAEQAASNPRVKHIYRTGEAKWGRLGGAVVDGFRAAQGDVLICMDGDLQHPPELVPQMVQATDEADLAVASRYCAGGDPGGLDGGVRKAVSRGTGVLAKSTFPKRLRNCTDPMSGFFAIRRRALDLDQLKPRGFKILLEIVARNKPMRIAEVPFTFGERVAGESHASLAEGLRFFRQLATLRLDNPAMRFLLVGASGVLPNLFVLWLLTGSGMHYIPATVLAIQCGVLWNFVGAELVVWRDHRVGKFWHRFVKYVAIAEMDLIRLPFIVLLYHLMGGHAVFASAITLVVMFLLRYTLADRLVYRRRVAEIVPVVLHSSVPEEP